METITVKELLCHRSPLSSHSFHCHSSQKQPSSLSPEGELEESITRKRKLSEMNQPSASKEILLDLLKNPSVLVGRIQLWNASSHSSSRCSYLDCLAFSDESDTICCILQEINPQFLGKLVQIKSWSFIPRRGERGRKGKDGGRGCLEIRLFEVIGEIASAERSIYLNHELASLPNFVMETPPFKQKKKTGKSRIVLTGCVTFISPPFAIPCGEIRGSDTFSRGEMCGLTESDQCSKKMTLPKGTIKDQNNNDDDIKDVGASKALDTPLLGFFVGLTACNPTLDCVTPGECILTNTNSSNPKTLMGCMCYIYFSGSPAAWRPILLALSGRFVSISDLRRKILMAGRNQTKYSTYAATRTSIISLLSMDLFTNMQGSDHCDFLRKHNNQQNVYKGKHLTSYIGVVTDMFIRGRLLELDGCIWLLLIHQPLSQVHGLRVGATVAAHHVHFLKLKSSFECSLLLATCSVSHVVVTRFSPYRTLYAGKCDLQSCLGRFIESLSFLSAFRALQIITSFKLKFECFYNEKEILGSTKAHQVCAVKTRGYVLVELEPPGFLILKMRLFRAKLLENVIDCSIRSIVRGIAENYIRSVFNFGASQFRDVFSEFFSHSASCSLSGSDCDYFTLQVPPINSFCKQIHIMWLDKNSYVWKQENERLERKNSVVLQNNFFRRVLSSDMIGVALIGFLQFSKVSGRLQLVDATGAIDVVIPDLETSECFQQVCQVTIYDLIIEGYVKPLTSRKFATKDIPLSWHNILKGTTGDIEVFTSLSFYLIFRIKEVYIMQHMKNIKLSNSSNEGRQITDNDENYACNFYVLLVLHKYPLRIKSFEKSTDKTNISFCLEAVRLPYTLCMLHELKGNEKIDEFQDSSVLCIASRLCQSKQSSTVPGILRRAVAQKQHCGVYGYTHHRAVLKKGNICSEPKAERVLLQFKNRDFGFHQGIKIGQYYLMEFLPPCAVVTVATGNCFLSMVVEYTSDIQVSPPEGSGLPLVDIILKVPLSLNQGFDSILEDARKNISPVLSVSEVLEQKICYSGIYYSTQEHIEQSRLLKGSLISFIGVIEGIQSFPFTNGDFSTRNHHENFFKMLIMRDINSSSLVKVKLDPDYHILPPGFGPTAVVTLHRVLLQLSTDGETILNCISSTLVVVDSISLDSYMALDGTVILHNATALTHNVTEMHQVNSTKIDAMFRSDHVPNLLQIQCQMVSVEWILFERKEALDCKGGHSTVQSINYIVSYMFFTIDDGSGLTRCWAKDDVAANFLNLPIHIDQSLENIISSEAMINARHLNLLLKKYGMIMLHSLGRAHDITNDRIMFYDGKDRTLDFEEQKFLYALIRKACHGVCLEIIAEHSEPETTHNFGHISWNNYTDLPHLQVKKVNTLNYERYLSLLCQELSETLKPK